MSEKKKESKELIVPRNPLWSTFSRLTSMLRRRVEAVTVEPSVSVPQARQLSQTLDSLGRDTFFLIAQFLDLRSRLAMSTVRSTYPYKTLTLQSLTQSVAPPAPPVASSTETALVPFSRGSKGAEPPGGSKGAEPPGGAAPLALAGHQYTELAYPFARENWHDRYEDLPEMLAWDFRPPGSFPQTAIVGRALHDFHRSLLENTSSIRSVGHGTLQSLEDLELLMANHPKVAILRLAGSNTLIDGLTLEDVNGTYQTRLDELQRARRAEAIRRTGPADAQDWMRVAFDWIQYDASTFIRQERELTFNGILTRALQHTWSRSLRMLVINMRQSLGDAETDAWKFYQGMTVGGSQTDTNGWIRRYQTFQDPFFVPLAHAAKSLTSLETLHLTTLGVWLPSQIRALTRFIREAPVLTALMLESSDVQAPLEYSQSHTQDVGAESLPATTAVALKFRNKQTIDEYTQALLSKKPGWRRLRVPVLRNLSRHRLVTAQDPNEVWNIFKAHNTTLEHFEYRLLHRIVDKSKPPSSMLLPMMQLRSLALKSLQDWPSSHLDEMCPLLQNLKLGECDGLQSIMTKFPVTMRRLRSLTIQRSLEEPASLARISDPLQAFPRLQRLDIRLDGDQMYEPPPPPSAVERLRDFIFKWCPVDAKMSPCPPLTHFRITVEKATNRREIGFQRQWTSELLSRLSQCYGSTLQVLCLPDGAQIQHEIMNGLEIKTKSSGSGSGTSSPEKKESSLVAVDMDIDTDIDMDTDVGIDTDTVASLSASRLVSSLSAQGGKAATPILLPPASVATKPFSVLQVLSFESMLPSSLAGNVGNIYIAQAPQLVQRFVETCMAPESGQRIEIRLRQGHIRNIFDRQDGQLTSLYDPGYVDMGTYQMCAAALLSAKLRYVQHTDAKSNPLAIQARFPHVNVLVELCWRTNAPFDPIDYLMDNKSVFLDRVRVQNKLVPTSIQQAKAILCLIPYLRMEGQALNHKETEKALKNIGLAIQKRMEKSYEYAQQQAKLEASL